MSANNLVTAVVQQKCTADTEANTQYTIEQIRSCASSGAKLVVLQELHRSLYFCQQEDTNQFDLAEVIPGPSTSTYSSLARELNIVIVCSLFEKRAAGIYHNTAVVLDTDGSIAGQYRKMHIPDDPGFYEKFYFTPGDMGFNPIETSLGKLGVLICWDQWFPEAARMMAMAGADLLIYPTAIGWDPNDDVAEKARQRDAWVTIQRSHAIANGLPILVANRVGHEDDPKGGAGIDFWGSSFMCGPQGEFLAQASEADPQNLVVDINLSHSENVRRIWPFFRDRRIDEYQDLLKRYRS